MNVLYVPSVGAPGGGRRKQAQGDSSCFKELEGLDAYAKEVYFYPTSASETFWLWVLGYEKATRDKNITRMWSSLWGFQLCTGGKGYYNGIPITKGTCFVSWPGVRYTLVTDSDDPLEFYWLLINGRDTLDFINSCGFNDSHEVFRIENYENLVNLFEHGINMDYSQVDVYSYTVGLAKMLLAFNKPKTEESDVMIKLHAERNYTKFIKLLLKNNNYTLTVDELSAKIGLTSKHLSKVFYKETGEHLKQYIVRKKMDFAAKLIRNGMTPTETSIVLKYSNYASFHKMFVSRIGMTPAEYSKSVNLSEH